ncbi:hypothetical protein K378_03615 [Streptomyces sp. Amel2xB2]|uniref:hypothetical protein n=1 Tax=Streptomyces sp. Amel2xB2 TaxID=1305829 RepID=UPI000DBA4A9D|nr:hypothetical protein [Streptomyces sp. Amel2xB2]RAJ63500.1 hypothetical protein K378_03615 [Streptomyces sp. Amel2xB2]
MDGILSALEPEVPHLPDVEDRVTRFVALARDVHRAAEVAILEGPAHVIEAAGQVTHASAELSDVMRRMADKARSGIDARRTADRALAAQREHDLYQRVQRFRPAARTALGNTD